MALINLSFRLSALEFCKEITAQTAAGIHPIKVICKIKQMIPVMILPLRMNEINGKKMAIKVIIRSVYILAFSKKYEPFVFTKIALTF